MAQPTKSVQLVVTFLGAVKDLNPGEIIDQFKVTACDDDYKMGSGYRGEDDKNGGLVITFDKFTGTMNEAAELTQAVAKRLDEMQTANSTYRFLGAFQREGESKDFTFVSKDGYAIAVTPKPAPQT